MTAGATSASILKLSDDSATVTGTSTVAGVRYNVVSGSDGTIELQTSILKYEFIFEKLAKKK